MHVILWSAICFKIMTRYTCGFFPRILAIIPAKRDTCVFLSRILAFFPALWGFYSQVYDHFLTNVHIYARKKSRYISVTNKHVYKGSQKVFVWGAPNYTVSRKPLHVRWRWKVTPVWNKHGSNGRVNFEQGLVFIHYPHSSGGCWLPDNGFVGIRGLFLERLCTLFHKCSDRNILGEPGADSGGEGKSKRAGKYSTKKSKERREEPLRTMSYQTSSKRSPPFWLLIGARKLLCFSAQSEARLAATVLELVW